MPDLCAFSAGSVDIWSEWRRIGNFAWNGIGSSCWESDRAGGKSELRKLYTRFVLCSLYRRPVWCRTRISCFQTQLCGCAQAGIGDEDAEYRDTSGSILTAVYIMYKD